jgi:Flp pilus assembly protein TadG
MIAPLVVTILIGSLEMGRYVVSRGTLSYATIQGGRTAATMGTTNSAAVRAMVKNSAPMLALADGDIDIQVAGGAVNDDASFTGRVVGNQVTVTVRYTFQPALNVAGVLTSKNWTDSNTSVVE